MNKGDRLGIMLSDCQARMKVRLIVAVLFVVTAGCTKPANNASPPYESVPAPPSPIAPLPSEVPAEQPNDTDLETLELEGTSWRVGVFTYTFQNGGHVIVKGGHLDKLSPSGAPGRYSVKGDDITITVMRRRYKARREGGALFIEGRKATRIDQGNSDTAQ